MQFSGDKAATVGKGNIKEIAKQAGLTAREKDVLEQLIKGSSHKAIAQSLNVSENTVKTHLRNIYIKMNVHNKSELMALIFGSSMPDDTSLN